MRLGLETKTVNAKYDIILNRRRFQSLLVETLRLLRVAAALALRLLHLCQILEFEAETCKNDAAGVGNQDCQFKAQQHCDSQKISKPFG
jgi:hypothetical protein